MKPPLLLVLVPLLFSALESSAQEGDIEWRHQVTGAAVALMANPLGRASRAAFYGARGFSAEAIRPYAEACGFSFGMKNGGAVAIRTRLADWRAVGADGTEIGLEAPAAWDARWQAAGVTEGARITFRWAQFQAEVLFEPGDWIMGMATLTHVPRPPFRLVVRYQDEKGDHELFIDKLACAD